MAEPVLAVAIFGGVPLVGTFVQRLKSRGRGVVAAVGTIAMYLVFAGFGVALGGPLWEAALYVLIFSSAPIAGFLAAERYMKQRAANPQGHSGSKQQ